MKFFKSFWGSITHNNDVIKSSPGIDKDNTPIGPNIYVPEDTSRAEFAKKFGKVHVGFKYRFIVPVMLIAKKCFLPKYKHVGAVENNIYNRELFILEKSMNDAMEDMIAIYEHNTNARLDKEQGLEPLTTTKNRLRNLPNDDHIYEMLKITKQSALHIIGMDGWYHEYNMFLMHRIAQNMTKEFSGTTYHRIVYDSANIYDPNWHVLQRQYSQIELEKKLVEDAKCQEIEIKKPIEKSEPQQLKNEPKQRILKLKTND